MSMAASSADQYGPNVSFGARDSGLDWPTLAILAAAILVALWLFKGK